MSRVLTSLLIGMAGLVFVSGTADARSRLERALRSVCGIVETGAITAALQHEGERGSAAQILENVGPKWVGRYNRFAGSMAPGILLAHTDQATKTYPSGSYPERACRTLRPILAGARSANAVGNAGAAIADSDLVKRCGNGFCITPAIEEISDRCDYIPFMPPIKDVCAKYR